EHYEPSKRRRRLGEVIISGFDSLLRRSSTSSSSSSSGASQCRPAIDGRGAGYVVWVPRREQLQEEGEGQGEEEGVWDGEEEEEGGCTPVVLYGGGHGGLFTGGLEQALNGFDCLSPPLRWVRLPLELLPPPAPAPNPTRRSTGAPLDADTSAPSRSAYQRSRGRNFAENSAGGSGAAKNRGRGTSSNDSSSARAISERGARGDPAVTNPGEAALRGGKGVSMGSVEGGDFVAGEEDGGKSKTPRAQEAGAGRNMGGRVRQREVVDLWWLTDPPSPSVSADTFRLRVATEVVRLLPTDAGAAPDVVCTIEARRGGPTKWRPYAAGRLQRYPNVVTSAEPYRAVCSYRGGVSRDGSLFSSMISSPPTAGGFPQQTPAFSPSSSSSVRGGGGKQRDGAKAGAKGGAKVVGEVSVMDVKPSHWYNVRHRFSWRAIDGGLEDVEEVVTATRHVHTHAYTPPVTPPSRPRATLVCSGKRRRRRRRRRREGGGGGGGGGGGLVFHLRVRWGGGAGVTGRNEGRLFFARGGTPQENEYLLQESTFELLPSSGATHGLRTAGGNGDTAREKKARPFSLSPSGLSATGGGGGGGGGGRGDGDNSSVDRSNETALVGQTNSSGGTTTTTSSHFYGGSDEGYSEGRWGEWTTICKTRRAAETVQLPRTFDRGGVLPLGLRYRVGARRREEGGRAAFSEVLEVPNVLLHRLYHIEELSSAAQNAPPNPDSKRRAARTAPPATPGSEWGARRDGLGREEAMNFVEAFSLSGDRDDFPARVAWELQNKLWRQRHREVMNDRASPQGQPLA
ncbi:unnamed protein product, partial [Laminaria digitata]